MRDEQKNEILFLVQLPSQFITSTMAIKMVTYYFTACQMYITPFSALRIFKYNIECLVCMEIFVVKIYLFDNLHISK